MSNFTLTPLRQATSDTNTHYLRFRQKFKSFTEQYELRELHFHALMRTKECEVQLSLARAEEQRKRAEDEIKKSRTLNSQVSTFSQTETELRSQLNIYVEKFKQVGLSLPNLLVASASTFPFRLQYAVSRHAGVLIFIIHHVSGWRANNLPCYNSAAKRLLLSSI